MGDLPRSKNIVLLSNRPRQRRSSPPVYYRDFAYANNAPVLVAEPPRMARPNIRDLGATSFAELLSGPMVDIYVGPGRKQWTLHRNLLCHHSTYFETEFVGHEVPKKTQTKEHNTLELPDDDPRGFELLVKWLYQGELQDVSEMDDESKYDYAVACHKLYMLCDKFDMLMLKNLAIDQYRLGLHDSQLVPDADEIDDIYRASPSKSPFRLLMAKIAARQIMDPEIEKDAESYRSCFENNPDFAVDMINSIRSLSGGILFEDPTDGDFCDYHDHSDGQNCHIKGKAKGPATKPAPKLQLGTNPEKRTPRKLDVSKGPQGMPNGASQQFDRKSALSKSPTKSPMKSPTKVNGHLETGKPNGQKKVAIAAPPASACSDRRSSSATMDSRPGKVGRMNGIFEQTNGVNGILRRDSRSTIGESDGSKPVVKKQPKKLGKPLAAQQTAVAA